MALCVAGISWPDPASAYEQLLGTPLDGQSTSDSNSSLVVDVYRKRSRMTDPTLDMGKMINKVSRYLYLNELCLLFMLVSLEGVECLISGYGLSNSKQGCIDIVHQWSH